MIFRDLEEQYFDRLHAQYFRDDDDDTEAQEDKDQAAYDNERAEQEAQRFELRESDGLVYVMPIPAPRRD